MVNRSSAEAELEPRATPQEIAQLSAAMLTFAGTANGDRRTMSWQHNGTEMTLVASPEGRQLKVGQRSIGLTPLNHGELNQYTEALYEQGVEVLHDTIRRFAMIGRQDRVTGERLPRRYERFHDTTWWQFYSMEKNLPTAPRDLIVVSDLEKDVSLTVEGSRVRFGNVRQLDPALKQSRFMLLTWLLYGAGQRGNDIDRKLTQQIRDRWVRSGKFGSKD